MSMDATSLPNDPALLKELVSQQLSTIESLTSKLAQLEHYVAQLVRARFGPRSEKLDPNQLSLFEGSAVLEEPAEGVAPLVETQREAHVRRSGGRNALSADLPRERRCLPSGTAAGDR